MSLLGDNGRSGYVRGDGGATARRPRFRGFDHPQKIFDLTGALIRRGYSDDNISAVLGGNFRRLLGATWT
jgi:microsomal dipeptidase-like Zn-dependent dipeptidase